MRIFSFGATVHLFEVAATVAKNTLTHKKLMTCCSALSYLGQLNVFAKTEHHLNARETFQHKASAFSISVHLLVSQIVLASILGRQAKTIANTPYTVAFTRQTIFDRD